MLISVPLKLIKVIKVSSPTGGHHTFHLQMSSRDSSGLGLLEGLLISISRSAPWEYLRVPKRPEGGSMGGSGVAEGHGVSGSLVRSHGKTWPTGGFPPTCGGNAAIIFGPKDTPP